jgi:glycosyltransferase involved in cell wall biosynthesis
MSQKPEIVQREVLNDQSRNLEIPLASVVIVNLNQGHYLRDCLVSVLSQTYRNIEVIIQDGGSTDNSLEVLKEFPQVDLVSEKDVSSGHAFAKASTRAKGDYLFFLNSSDGFYSDNWVERAVEILIQSDLISMVTGTVLGVNSDSSLNTYTWPKGRLFSDSPKINFYSWLFDGIGFTPITFGIKANVFSSLAISPDRVVEPNDSSSVDFFWDFSEKFFSSGFISVRTDLVSSFVRFHDDRVNDANYLKRQQMQLHRFILEFRRHLLFGRTKYIFVSSSGLALSGPPITLVELWWNFFCSKLLHAREAGHSITKNLRISA